MPNTPRLTLTRPSLAEVDELFAITSDPRLWSHYPTLRPTAPEQTRRSVERWLVGWDANGLDLWTVRVTGQPAVIGYGGCSVHRGAWNLTYRLAAAAQGFGYATELARAAVEHARQSDAERPVVARLLEHNAASRRVAERVGLSLAYRALDEGNPDPRAVRLIFADRVLSGTQLRQLIAPAPNRA